MKKIIFKKIFGDFFVLSTFDRRHEGRSPRANKKKFPKIEGNKFFCNFLITNDSKQLEGFSFKFFGGRSEEF